jgi:hypothetical protein
MSDAQIEYAMDLIAVQQELPRFAKDATASVKTDKASFSYSYADLTTITDAALPVLNKHGFSFICLPHVREEDKQFVLRYVLLHKAGHSVTGDYPLGAGSAQQIGSAITYGRRYCLCAVTGIAPAGEDDDGKKASEPPPPAQPQRTTDEAWLEDALRRVDLATTQAELAAIDATAHRKYETFDLTADDGKRLKAAITAREAEIKGEPA